VEPSTGPNRPVAAIDRSLREAVEFSHLNILPRDTIARLLRHATQYPVAAGSTIRRERDEAPHFELVLSGLLRIYVTALDGRTLTVRYCRPGSIMGTVSLFASPFSMPGSTRAVTDAVLLAFPPTMILEASAHDVEIARALLNELSERVLAFAAEIPGSAFTSVRQRVARHLLDLASADQVGPGLVAKVSQQELAEAAGTVREVVVRVLRDLRREGIIETRRGGIDLVDPQRLTEEPYLPSGTNVP
jgi:CRP/FNR family transcriptional regulator, cyclic AMP receptor protein